MNRNSFYDNLSKYKQNDELMHYGTLGQKWGVRKWQNYDGTFNEAGKERYFGKSSKAKTTEEEKVGSNKSNVKDYLKFRNKMLKQRTRSDLNQWYRDKMKDADKQLIKDAKRVDKQQMKMYKNQLKDFYDNPEELVNDLDRMYRIGESPEEYQRKMKKLNLLAKEFDLPTGNFEINNGVGVIKRADKDFYDDEAINIISKNSKVINKMMNALNKNDSDTYMELRNKSFKNDMEKDICEEFINDARVYKELEKVKKETAKELKNIQKPIKKDMDFEIHYDDKVGVYDMKKDRDNIIKDNKAKERMQDFVDNYEKYIDKIADKVADYWAEDGKITIWSNNKPMSKNDFIKRFKNHYEEKLINSGNVSEDGSIYLDFNDDGMFGYHGILAIIEPDGSLHDNTGSLEG